MNLFIKLARLLYIDQWIMLMNKRRKMLITFDAKLPEPFYESEVLSNCLSNDCTVLY